MHSKSRLKSSRRVGHQSSAKSRQSSSYSTTTSLSSVRSRSVLRGYAPGHMDGGEPSRCISTYSPHSKSSSASPMAIRRSLSTTPDRRKSRRSLRQSLTPSTDVQSHIPIAQQPHGVIVRDFIRESLYSRQGYFNASRVINSPGVVNFNQLLGKAAYEKRLSELYFSGVQGWTTPVEIFQPFYAHGLARYFLSHIVDGINKNSQIDPRSYTIYQQSQQKQSESADTTILATAATAQQKKSKQSTTATDDFHFIPSLSVDMDNKLRRYGWEDTKRDQQSDIPFIPEFYEIGAGNGTCASNILDYLSTFYPNVYKHSNYTILEMSESLSSQQQELLDGKHDGHYNVFTVNAAEFKGKDYHRQQQLQAEEASGGNINQSSNKKLNKQQQQQQQNAKEQQSTSTKKKKPIHSFIFGLEVLDNMVHDKVIKGDDGKWYQVMVCEKRVIDAIKHAAETTPDKLYQFSVHTNPHTSSLSVKDTQTTTESKVNEQDHQAAPQEDAHQPTKTTKMSVPASLLYSWISENPFKINSSKLNLNPQSKYHEYVIPINDPIVEQCVELYNSYLDLKQQLPPVPAAQDPLSMTSSGINETGLPKKTSPLKNWFYQKFSSRKLQADTEVLYLPTELLRFFHVVDQQFPSHTLLLADFDQLPSTETIRATHGPVVAHKETESQLRGKTKDEPSYLVDLGLCDIFFPTDFTFVKYMYTQIILKDQPFRGSLTPMLLGSPHGQQNQSLTDISTMTATSPVPKDHKHALSKASQLENAATVLTQKDFLWRYANIDRTECRNGYNPMLEDYANMAFFVGTRHPM